MDEACDRLQSTLVEIVQLKRVGADHTALRQRLAEGALDVVKLRCAARNQVQNAEHCKAQAAESKLELDQYNLQLQNLLYEKNYYNKEIAACRSFKSKFTDDDISLVEKQKFYDVAPQKFKEKVDDDEHNLHLQRLAFEKHERLELLKLLESVKQKKEAADLVVAGKRKRLDDIQSEVAAIKQKSVPVLETLQLPVHGAKQSQTCLAAANLLPVPLFIIFHQASAVKDACDYDLDISVQGSDKEAESWAESLGSSLFGIAEKDPGQAKKKRKIEKASQAVQHEVLEAHPQSVALMLRDGEKAIAMQFTYLPKLETVTVRALDAAQQQVLASIFPEDTGVSLPSEAARHIALANNVDFGAERSDRPYMWAQQIAGLDFLPALSSSCGLADPLGKETIAAGLLTYRKQQRIQHVLHRLNTVSFIAVQGQATSVAGGGGGGSARPVKRIRTWDEIVAERAQLQNELQPGHAERQAASSARDSRSSQEKEDAGPPEEGELPDTQ